MLHGCAVRAPGGMTTSLRPARADRRAARQLGLSLDPVLLAPARREAIMFASGSNLPGEIRGLAALELPIGVAVQELNDEAVAALTQLAGRDLPVFADSGAFSEVDRTDVTRVAKPITDAEWRRRLGVMQHLADHLGAQLTVVAPDQIANQTVTLERLARYAPEVRRLHAAGAVVLVVLQSGPGAPLDRLAFFDAVTETLGFRPVPAFPMKKNAMTPVEAVAAMDALLGRDVTRVHLLGFGLENPKAAQLFPALAARGVTVSCDSCIIAAHAGRANGANGGPRALTAAADAFDALVTEAQWNDVVLATEGEDDLGLFYTDEIVMAASDWMSPAARRRIVGDAFFPPAKAGGTPALRSLFLADPTAALLSDLVPPDEAADGAPLFALPDGLDDDERVTLAEYGYLHHALDAEWQRYCREVTVAHRKSRGVQQVFADHPARRRHLAAPTGIRPRRAA